MLDYRRARPTLPFEPPNAALTQILNEIGAERDKTRAGYMPDRGIDNSVAGSFSAKPSGKALPGWIGDARICVQNRTVVNISRTQIVKHTEKVGNQFGVVGDILKTPDRFEFARQVIRNLADGGLDVICAIPCAAIIIVEAVSARPRVCEGGIDEGVARTTKHELTRVKLRQPGFLCDQPAIGDTLQGGEVFKGTMVGGERKQYRTLEAAGRNQPYRIALCDIDSRRQRHLQTAAQRIDMATNLKHFRDAAFDHRIERAKTAVERSLIGQPHPFVRQRFGK